MTAEQKAPALGLTIVNELNTLNPALLVFKGEQCIYGSSRREFVDSFLESYDASHDYVAPKRSIRKPRKS